MKCPICSSVDITIRYESTMSHAEDSYAVTEKHVGIHGTIVSCHGCGFAWVVDTELVESLVASYSQSGVDTVYEKEVAGRKKTNRKQIQEIGRYLSPPAKLLDIGCYTGIFLDDAQQHGFSVFGLEPSQAAYRKARARGLAQVINGSVTDDVSYFKSDFFDVITAFDVIEHLVDPHALPRFASLHVKTGGILVISTPDFDSLFSRIAGESWHAIIPHHVTYYSKKTLGLLLEHHGFEVLKVARLTRYFSIQYLLTMLGERLPVFQTLLSWFAKSIFGKLMLPVNLCDQVVVYARKK